MDSILNFIIPTASAQAAAGGGEMGMLNLLFPIILIGAFYFMLIRPQTKRAKEHKQMVESLKKGDEVSLVGFGTFYVGKRAARTGRNPQTGAEIQIPEKTVIKFRPGKGKKQ